MALRHPTIDLDACDIEVYGKTKRNVGWTYAGVKAGRVHLASWAQAELPLAADLLAGNDDVRPDAGTLLGRALAVLPAQVYGRARVRADAGYFDAELAHTAVALGWDFAIAAKRNSAAWRALCRSGRRLARRPRDARASWSQLVTTPQPAGHRAPTPSSGGAADHVWAVSFLVTNIPADHGDLIGLEAWFRNRTSIKERFREAKHGSGLNHLPRPTPA